SRIIPCVYICLRDDSGNVGYPYRTPKVAEYINAGVIEQLGATQAKGTQAVDALHDPEYEYPTLKFATLLLSFLTSLDSLSRGADELENDCGLGVWNLGWMWEFFAEPQKKPPNGSSQRRLAQRQSRFWQDVVAEAQRLFTFYVTGIAQGTMGDYDSFL